MLMQRILRIEFLQPARGADECAARSQTRDEMRDLARASAPRFLAPCRCSAPRDSRRCCTGRDRNIYLARLCKFRARDGSRRRCLRRPASSRARRHTPAKSCSAPATRSTAGTVSLYNRAPRRPSHMRCRCCRSSRRESSFPGADRPVRSPSRIIEYAARSFTEPPGLNHSAFAKI